MDIFALKNRYFFQKAEVPHPLARKMPKEAVKFKLLGGNLW